MVKVLGYILFYGEFVLGVAFTLYGLFLVGYKMYLKLMDVIHERKMKKALRNSK